VAAFTSVDDSKINRVCGISSEFIKLNADGRGWTRMYANVGAALPRGTRMKIGFYQRFSVLQLMKITNPVKDMSTSLCQC
jgi:hypothetical protein